MIAVIRAELYRMATVRSLWLSMLAATLLAGTLAAFGVDDWAWASLVGMTTFLLAVVGVGQHYQHRTSVLGFLARPRRLSVLCGQTLAYASVATVLVAVSGLPMVAHGMAVSYLATVLAVPFLAAFGVASALVLRRPIWIVAGYGVWFFVVEGFLGRLELPGPFTGYLRWSAQQGALGVALIGWTVLSLLVAAWAVRRDVGGE